MKESVTRRRTSLQGQLIAVRILFSCLLVPLSLFCFFFISTTWFKSMDIFILSVNQKL